MQVVYTHEPFPRTASKSLFLAGPSPHKSSRTIWQDEALTTLRDSGYDGCVFVPLPRDGTPTKDYVAQSDWEQEAMDRSDVILFWIPRNLEMLPGFTTNVEFGQRVAEGNVVLGYPLEAPNMRYLAYLAQRNSVGIYHSLPETISAALQMIAERIETRKEIAKNTQTVLRVPRQITDEERFCINNTSSYKQYYTMRKRFEKNECSFCDLDDTLNTVLFENQDWIVLENAFRNGRPCRVMVLIITKRHTRKLNEITRKAWSGLSDVLAHLERTFDLPGGMLFMRFGDMRFNAGTVPHLHINLWVPDQTSELHASIFKGDEERVRHTKRAAEFSKWYEAGDTPEMH